MKFLKGIKLFQRTNVDSSYLIVGYHHPDSKTWLFNLTVSFFQKPVFHFVQALKSKTKFIHLYCGYIGFEYDQQFNQWIE
jgi:hypothetical protein